MKDEQSNRSKFRPQEDDIFIPELYRNRLFMRRRLRRSIRIERRLLRSEGLERGASATVRQAVRPARSSTISGA